MNRMPRVPIHTEHRENGGSRVMSFALLQCRIHAHSFARKVSKCSHTDHISWIASLASLGALRDCPISRLPRPRFVFLTIMMQKSAKSLALYRQILGLGHRPVSVSVSHSGRGSGASFDMAEIADCLPRQLDLKQSPIRGVGSKRQERGWSGE